jgi:hypothetical protein
MELVVTMELVILPAARQVVRTPPGYSRQPGTAGLILVITRASTRRRNRRVA